jgi:hypothetical protein
VPRSPRGVELAVDAEPYGIVGSRYDVEGDRVDLALHLVVLAADEPLRGVDGALGIQDRLASGHLSDEPLTGVQKATLKGSFGCPRRSG